MSRVLVTGATGFIGRHTLAPLVARGFDVHAVLHGPRVELDGVTWHETDLLADPAALVTTLAPSHLLHLAWYAVPGTYWTSRENLRWVRATLALYDAFLAAGGTRIVTAGSCAEYDWTGGQCTEYVTPLVPRTYYGVCKRAVGELIGADAKAAAISAAHARYFFLYGSHEYPERLVSSAIRTLLRGEVAKCSPGTQLRDFLHVADAADATVALLASTVEGPVNIASGELITVRGLVEQIQAITGGEVAFGALPADPDPRLAASVSRLRDEVDWTPHHTLAQRLRETIAWWKEHRS